MNFNNWITKLLNRVFIENKFISKISNCCTAFNLSFDFRLTLTTFYKFMSNKTRFTKYMCARIQDNRIMQKIHTLIATYLVLTWFEIMLHSQYYFFHFRFFYFNIFELLFYSFKISKFIFNCFIFAFIFLSSIS